MHNREEAVIALGMFDGMHIGHRAIVGRTVALARELGCEAAVYTFSNHPMSVLGGQPHMLSTPDMRESCMKRLGVANVCMEPFTRALAARSPEVFVDMLSKRWRVKAVVVGFNYTFGARGAGTPELLMRLGAVNGFLTEVVPPVLYLDEPVSSTRIRNLVELGKCKPVTDMLLHPYTLQGTVVANRRIGRRIGFPTANIVPAPDRVLPKRGVYATLATLDGNVYRAVTNIGTNPTVDGDKLSIETHLLGFEGNAYDKMLEVSFVRFLRDECKFDSVEALQRQITHDVAEAAQLETDD